MLVTDDMDEWCGASVSPIMLFSVLIWRPLVATVEILKADLVIVSGKRIELTPCKTVKTDLLLVSRILF